MRRMSWITLLLLLSALARAQAPAVGDYTKLAVQGDYVLRDFKFHTGEKLPELRLTEKWVGEGRGSFGWPDANDFIYMMELSNGFDAWSPLDRIHCPVLIINMAGDNMVPVELHHAEKVLTRLKKATYWK